MIHSRFGKLAIGVIAVLAVAFMSIGTGFASVGQIDDGLGVFAQGNGNGNGQGNGNGNGNNDDDEGNGSQDDDADAPDADTGEDSGNNGQGNGQGNGNGNGSQGDEDADDPETDTDENSGNNGQGNGRGGDVESDDDATGTDDDDASDDSTGSDDDDATPSDDSGKVGICHNTGSETNPLVYIEVSENAAAAHEAHGDTIGVASEDDCELDPDDGTPIATPVTGA